MKIAVYTIALNEEDNIQQWYDSAKDADYLLIADTGSTDKTVRLAKKLGINVIKISIKPWRFDDARQAALASLPTDIDMCVSLDMDEVLAPGWRKALEELDDDVTQVNYKYTWSWRDPTSRTQPQVVYVADKVHARHGYRWKYLVHEVVVPDRNDSHKKVDSEDFEIYHYGDIERSPNRYNEMVYQTWEENKDDKRYWVYKYECLLAEDADKARATVFEYLKKFKNDLSNEEKAKAYRTIFLTNSFKYYKMLKKSIRLSPNTRDYYVDSAIVEFNRGHLRRARKFAKKAMTISTRKLDMTYQEYVWGYLMKNMLYVCNYNLRFKNRNNKLAFNVSSLTSSSFDLFKETDVV
jgi:glycosyltransferase involved in cell wall biosynthesis